ncbi:MAG: GNAT family N-acetyltransferase [Clostridia bacterium]|nr:GNAT family N-acetyltransferase [Clostridia bacterium]
MMYPWMPNPVKDPNRIVRADLSHMEAIADMRVAQQVEHWSHTLDRNFDMYAGPFRDITISYLRRRLNHSLFYVIKYVDDEPVAMCALEEQDELPPITVCMDDQTEAARRRHGWVVSVYTKPTHRGRGYQQALMKELLQMARERGFSDVTLTTNRPDAIHVYEKAGFRHVSDKYFLKL